LLINELSILIISPELIQLVGAIKDIDSAFPIKVCHFQAFSRLFIVEFSSLESISSLSHIEELVIQSFTLIESNSSFSSVARNIQACIIFFIFDLIGNLRDTTIVSEGITSSKVPLLMGHISHELASF
jgi:hypothetical protein